MVIKASASAEVRTLVDALSSTDEVKREAAVARLAVIGPRAVERLLDAYTRTGDRRVRVGVLRALETIGDHRASVPARRALLEGGDVAIAGIAVLRGLLDSPHASTGSDALDGLMSVALDPTRDRRVRLAAVDALQGQSSDVLARLSEALGNDGAITVRESVRDADRSKAAADALWTDALEGHLPDDPALLRDVVSARAAVAPLSALQKLIDQVMRVESTTTSAETREQWRRVRGGIHQALALRGSRVALYDLRETLNDVDGRLPASFLAAVQVIGDTSCLEPLAAAFSRASKADQWWRHQLGNAFRAIAKREKITRRHAVVKRVLARWPDAGEIFTNAAA